jgi:hypothetical protein
MPDGPVEYLTVEDLLSIAEEVLDARWSGTSVCSTQPPTGPRPAPSAGRRTRASTRRRRHSWKRSLATMRSWAGELDARGLTGRLTGTIVLLLVPVG